MLHAFHAGDLAVCLPCFSLSIPAFVDLLQTKQFAFKICDAPEVGFDLSAMGVGMGVLDDACGAGTSEMEFTVEDYLTTIEDAVGLLEDYVGLSIPEEEAAGICEVRGGGGRRRFTSVWHGLTIYWRLVLLA